MKISRRSQVEDKDVNQSIMQLAYHLPITYKDEDYFALIVFNGLFGAFAHLLVVYRNSRKARFSLYYR